MLDINSKERMLYLQEQLLFQQRRIEGAEKMIESIEKEMSWSGDKCWGCECTGDTTALSLCEVGNPLYPSKCVEQVEKEKSNG